MYGCNLVTSLTTSSLEVITLLGVEQQGHVDTLLRLHNLEMVTF